MQEHPIGARWRRLNQQMLNFKGSRCEEKGHLTFVPQGVCKECHGKISAGGCITFSAQATGPLGLWPGGEVSTSSK